MEITVTKITDQEDGSCRVEFDMSPEALQALAGHGLKSAILDACKDPNDETPESKLEKIRDIAVGYYMSGATSQMEMARDILRVLNKEASNGS